MATKVISVRGRNPAELLADPDFVYVGRAVPRSGWKASIWGNPFKVGMDPFEAMRLIHLQVVVGRATHCAAIEIHGRLDAAKAVEFYAVWVENEIRRGALAGVFPSLRGKTLGCWCLDWAPIVGEPRRPCHAVVLARLADSLPA